MDMVEPFVALVVYPTTPGAQARQADNLARTRPRVGGRREPRHPDRVERPGVA